MNIVTIGGGTGSFTVLSGLKKLDNVDLKALVTMADDGGSAGVLMDELGVLPTGDVRQCLVALSEHTQVVRELMNYRFTEGGLKGHSFGNIFLAALAKMTGDFSKGIEIAGEVLKVNGLVIPITRDKARLAVKLIDNSVIVGQANIYINGLRNLAVKKIFYKEKVKLYVDAKEAIKKADYIILGPGNYYCSVVPNLIVNGFKEALKQSKAKIIMPINLTNKLNQTTFWKASDYVKNTEKFLKYKIDFIVINNKSPSKEQIKKYKLEEGDGVLVEDDLGNDSRVVRAPLISNVIYKVNAGDTIAIHRAFIRHDSDKLAKCIKKIISK